MGVKRTLLLVAGIITLGVFGLAFAVDRYGQRDRAVKSPAIVMLGARVLKGGVASGSLRARAEKAAELYRGGVAPLVVFSGGVGVNAPAEAELARRIAVSEGVPEIACVLEADSHSTDENARFTARLLKDRGITEVVLVSDPYHLLRASKYFRREGIEVHPSPALLSDRNMALPERLYWTMREAFALLAHPALWFV